jgi:hypothetical protein
MKLFIFVILFASSCIIQAVDWEGYRQAILKFERLGIRNDPLYESSRSAETRALSFPCDPKVLSPSPSVPTSGMK